MKKMFLVAAVALFSFGVNAQEGFKVGANLGLPIGDSGDVAGFSIGLDAMYHWAISDGFSAGVATGFTHAFGKKIDVVLASVDLPDVQFLPIAASGRFSFADKFSAGADLGFALGINEGNDGGFYYRPTVGYNIGEKTALNLSYTGISQDGGSWTTINLGVLFTL